MRLRLARVGEPVGPKVCHDAAPTKDPMDLFQGMDHALRSDSSKRPGKNRDVEALMGKSEVFGGRDPITDFLP